MNDILKTVAIASDLLPNPSWKRARASSGGILQTTKPEVQGQNITTLAAPDKVGDLIMNRINQ